MFACFQMYVKCFFSFFLVHRHVLTQSAQPSAHSPLSLNRMFLLQRPIIVFFGKAKFSFSKFHLKEAMRLSSTHVMQMTWKQNKQPKGI